MGWQSADRCPNCGSTMFRKTDDGVQCVNCESRYTNPYDTRTTNVHIYRDETKIAKYEYKERENRRNTIISVTMATIFIIGIVIFIIIYSINDAIKPKYVKAPRGSAVELRDQNFEIVKSIMSDAGYKDVETISLQDLDSADHPNYGKVSTVYIGGDDLWDDGVVFKKRKYYYDNTPVKIYYHGP